jgi:hypothetical protein
MMTLRAHGLNRLRLTFGSNLSFHNVPEPIEVNTGQNRRYRLNHVREFIHRQIQVEVKIKIKEAHAITDTRTGIAPIMVSGERWHGWC